MANADKNVDSCLVVMEWTHPSLKSILSYYLRPHWAQGLWSSIAHIREATRVFDHARCRERPCNVCLDSGDRRRTAAALVENALEIVDPYHIPAQDQGLLVIGHAGKIAGDGFT
jgi:hypothetical protein